MGNHKDLKNISSIYKTDKLEHGYIEIYKITRNLRDLLIVERVM